MRRKFGPERALGTALGTAHSLMATQDRPALEAASPESPPPRGASPSGGPSLSLRGHEDGVREAHGKTLILLGRRSSSAWRELLDLVQHEETIRRSAFQAVLGGELGEQAYQAALRSMLTQLLGRLARLASKPSLCRELTQCLSPYMSALSSHIDLLDARARGGVGTSSGATAHCADRVAEPASAAPASAARAAEEAGAAEAAAAATEAAGAASATSAAAPAAEAAPASEPAPAGRVAGSPMSSISSDTSLDQLPSLGYRSYSTHDPLARSFALPAAKVQGAAAVAWKSFDGALPALRRGGVEVGKRAGKDVLADPTFCGALPASPTSGAQGGTSVLAGDAPGAPRNKLASSHDSALAGELTQLKKRVVLSVPVCRSRSLPGSPSSEARELPTELFYPGQKTDEGALCCPDIDFRAELGAAYVEEEAGLVFERPLPSGTFASVAVWRRPSGEHVVVKRICLKGVDERGGARLTNEVLLLSALKHRHIIAFHGAHYARPDLCIRLGYAAAGTLEESISKQRARKRSFETCFVTCWLSQLVSAVLYMHEQGVLHRDISTSNVFLDFGGDILVGDLGLSKRVVMGGPSEADELATSAVGTPDFLSPELVRGEPYGRPSDAWAVGVILFNLLTLERPFQAASVTRLCRHIADYAVCSAAQTVLDSCEHPPELCALASRGGLLNPEVATRTSLLRVLEIYPLEEEDDEDEQASS